MSKSKDKKFREIEYILVDTINSGDPETFEDFGSLSDYINSYSDGIIEGYLVIHISDYNFVISKLEASFKLKAI